MRGLRSFLRDAWRLARPYYRSEEKWSAWGLLLSILALRLLLVGMTVILSFWNREFFNSLQDKDFAAFCELLFVYRQTPSGFMPGFCEIAAVYILVAVYFTYLSQWLQIRWRRWLTVRFLDEWLADRAYYRISLTTDRAAIGTDNPDQRIAEDIRDFVDNTLTLGISLLANIVTLVSFLGILWSLSGTITLFGIAIPGYMVWVALVYADRRHLAHPSGRPAAGLRCGSASSAWRPTSATAWCACARTWKASRCTAGEAEEKGMLGHRFGSRDRQLVGDHAAHQDAERAHRRLRAGGGDLPVHRRGTALLLRPDPAGRADPDRRRLRPGAGRAVVVHHAGIPTWRSGTPSSSGSPRSTARSSRRAPRSAPGLTLADAPDGTVQMRDATIELPNGAKLLDDADLVLEPGHSVVITGRSGSGKSTLFRALAGIWPFGHGRVQRPLERCLFLPQRPYIPLGTLRHVVTYPHPPDIATAARRSRRRWRTPACRSSSRGWTTTRPGRSNSPAASSSAWRWRAPCWRSRTGCSWTRRPPAWIPRPRPNSIAR